MKQLGLICHDDHDYLYPCKEGVQADRRDADLDLDRELELEPGTVLAFCEHANLHVEVQLIYKTEFSERHIITLKGDGGVAAMALRFGIV